MPDNAVSHVSYKRWVLMGLAGVGLSTVLMWFVFVSVRVRQVYAFESKVSELQSANRELLLNCTAHTLEEAERINNLERVLFGDVVPKVEKPPAALPATRIEALMLRNERELRQRVEALERWRLKMID